MANLSTFSTIHEKVKKYKKDYDLEELSNAFQWLALETILNLNEDEIEEAITDGPNDGGIDAIYVLGKNVHIFNFKYANTFKESEKNFPEVEIDKMLITIERIYNESLTKKDVNDALWDKVNDIWNAFKKEGSLMFKFYLCSNKEKPCEHAIRKFQSALDKYKFVEFYYLDQEDLSRKIIEKKYAKLNGSLYFREKQYFDRSDGGLKGIVATVSASDLIELIRDKEDPTKVNENAFNENVRVFLKLKNRINRSIYETSLSDDNYEFWYLNNGITILCEECIYTPGKRTPKVELTNFQIVNGGQTTHALFEAHLVNKEKIDDVLILVRICETKKEYGIAERISETTNSQTPVRTRDLHANDRVQRKLEEQFKDLGYFYERKKNQYQEMPKDKRLNNELLGQIYLAYYFDKPSDAKNQKTIIFDEMYDLIFNEESVTAEKMLVPFRVYQPLEKMKKEIQLKKRKKEKIDEKEAFVSRATFHILNAVKIIAEKEHLNLGDMADIKKGIDKAIVYINQIVQNEIKERGTSYTHDKFFKEIPTNMIIKNYIESKY